MISYFLTACLLIVGDHGIEDYNQFDDLLMREYLRVVSINLEILEKNEFIFMENFPEDNNESRFNWEITYLRDKWQEIKDAPAACLAKNFPPVSWDTITFAREHRNWVDAQLSICWSHQVDYYQEWLNEANLIATVLQCIHDAQEEHLATHFRRVKLKEAKEILGYKMFYEGTLPPPVSVWRSRVIGK